MIEADLVVVCETYAKKVDPRGFKKDPVAATYQYWKTIGNYPLMAKLYLIAKRHTSTIEKIFDL